MSGTPKGPNVEILRSPLGRVRGLGAAHQGSAHWWTQRLNSLALVPLTLWFIWSVIRLSGEPRAAMIAWMSGPVSLVLMLALIILTFQHMNLGLQVVIEDYVHDGRLKMGSVVLIRGLCFLLALLCIVSVLRIGL
ncbi:succinate dehydrogenase, hydrophobic membrane anchor protein [Rhodopila sp.]|uniref:succinate dehydrogenase, hydrophobic membrane anchor protein n=1 Tax=Rhodopila sp. TaxID=2480087 RepID=UPI003D148E46